MLHNRGHIFRQNVALTSEAMAAFKKMIEVYDVPTGKLVTISGRYIAVDYSSGI